MSSYKELRVWQEARTFTGDIYRLTQKLPKYELYGLSDQMRRAVVSIMSNIAEGAGRGTIQDYIRFLYLARGSAYEVVSQLIICKDLNYISADEIKLILSKGEHISWMINRLIDKLEMMKRNGQTVWEGLEPYGNESIF
mgnify:CR=1 FL=1